MGDDRVIDSISFVDVQEIVKASDLALDDLQQTSSNRKKSQRLSRLSYSLFTKMLKNEDAFKKIFGTPLIGNIFNLSQNSSEARDEHEAEDGSVLHIRTILDSDHSGRSYCLRAISTAERETIFVSWVHNTQLATAKNASQTLWQWFHTSMKVLYNSSYFQFLVSLLIFTVRLLFSSFACIARLPPPEFTRIL